MRRKSSKVMELSIVVLFLFILSWNCKAERSASAPAKAIYQILTEHLPACQRIVIRGDHNQTHLVDVEEKLLLHLTGDASSTGVLMYSSQDLFTTSPPSPSVLVSRLNTLCVSYVLFTSLPEAAEIYQFLAKSDWFLGATRYVLWFGADTIQMKDITKYQVLKESFNFAFLSPKEEEFTIYGICPFCDSGNPEVVIRNRWSEVGGFRTSDAIYPFLFKDCNGHEFRMVTLDFDPFMDYEKNGEGEAVTIKDSLDVRIMNTIAKQLNFTYKVYEPVDGQWGYQLPNKSWTGVIGTIERYEADFSMDISITSDREPYVDFTIGYHLEPLTFALSKPAPLPQWLSLIRPFRMIVWATLIVSVVVAATVQWLLLKGGGQTTSEANKTKSSLLFAGEMVYRIFLRQDSVLPSSSSGQIFSGFWLLFSLVMTISYVSNLTAFMTAPAFSTTLNSLDELARSDMSWGVAGYKAADYQLLKTSNVPLYQKIFKELKFCPSKPDCLQRTLDEPFAYISWITYIRDSVASDFTDRNGDNPIHIARETFFPGEYGFTLQKNSPWKKSFDGVIRKLLEGGFVPMWLTDFIVTHQRDGQKKSLERDLKMVGGDLTKLAKKNEGEITLTLYHLQGVFSIYGGGLLLAAIAFLFEIIFGLKMRK